MSINLLPPAKAPRYEGFSGRILRFEEEQPLSTLYGCDDPQLLEQLERFEKSARIWIAEPRLANIRNHLKTNILNKEHARAELAIALYYLQRDKDLDLQCDCYVEKKIQESLGLAKELEQSKAHMSNSASFPTGKIYAFRFALARILILPTGKGNVQAGSLAVQKILADSRIADFLGYEHHEHLKSFAKKIGAFEKEIQECLSTPIHPNLKLWVKLALNIPHHHEIPDFYGALAILMALMPLPNQLSHGVNCYIVSQAIYESEEIEDMLKEMCNWLKTGHFQCEDQCLPLIPHLLGSPLSHTDVELNQVEIAPQKIGEIPALKSAMRFAGIRHIPEYSSSIPLPTLTQSFGKPRDSLIERSLIQLKTDCFQLLYINYLTFIFNNHTKNPDSLKTYFLHFLETLIDQPIFFQRFARLFNQTAFFINMSFDVVLETNGTYSLDPRGAEKIETPYKDKAALEDWASNAQTLLCFDGKAYSSGFTLQGYINYFKRILKTLGDEFPAECAHFEKELQSPAFHQKLAALIERYSKRRVSEKVSRDFIQKSDCIFFPHIGALDRTFLKTCKGRKLTSFTCDNPSLKRMLRTLTSSLTLFPPSTRRALIAHRYHEATLPLAVCSLPFRSQEPSYTTWFQESFTNRINEKLRAPVPQNIIEDLLQTAPSARHLIGDNSLKYRDLRNKLLRHKSFKAILQTTLFKIDISAIPFPALFPEFTLLDRESIKSKLGKVAYVHHVADVMFHHYSGEKKIAIPPLEIEEKLSDFFTIPRLVRICDLNFVDIHSETPQPIYAIVSSDFTKGPDSITIFENHGKELICSTPENYQNFSISYLS